MVEIQPDSISTTESFGRELTRLRESAGLSVRQVAAKLAVDGGFRAHSTVGEWFAGRSVPSLASRELFLRLLRVCGVADTDLESWQRAWQRVRRTPGRRAGQVAPYRGLTSFGVGDSDWFFGREDLTGRLIEHVSQLDALGGGLLLVVGASGSGKSSVIRAGALASLARGAVSGSQCWPAVVMTPGACPSHTLEQQLAAEPVDSAERGGGRRLVVVDQFEELFTAGVAEAERSAFVAELCAATEQGAIVIAGLRADFYAQALAHPQLRVAAQSHQVTVGPMSRAELTETIVGPARMARLDVEDGLVDLVCRAIEPARNAAVLPLLSQALYRTWQRGDGRRLKIADFVASGGIDDAVAATAEDVYSRLDPERQALARVIFMNLVHVCEDGPNARRRLVRSDLMAVCGHSNTTIQDVLDAFIAQRLVTAHEEYVEVSHETLLTAWPRLGQWLAADRANLVVKGQLVIAADTWNREGRDRAALYRGARLLATLEWIKERPDTLPAEAVEFVDASARHAQRATRRLYMTVALLVALVVAATGAGAIAVDQSSRADSLRAAAVHERDEALSRLVASRADQLRAKDSSLSAQLALTAYRIAPTVEARSSLIGTAGSPLAFRLINGGGPQVVSATAFDPAGRVIAAAVGADIRLWHRADRGRPTPLGTVRPAIGTVRTVAFSPDGKLLAAGGDSGQLVIWDMADPGHATVLGTLRIDGSAAVFSLAFSPDGGVLAAGTASAAIERWSIGTPVDPRPLDRIEVPGGVVKSLAYSPDGRLIASGSENGAVVLWQAGGAQRLSPASRPSGPTKEIGQLAISPDGRWLAAGGKNNTVYLWNISAPTSPQPVAEPIAGARSWINALGFNPGSTLLAIGSSDSSVGLRIWDLTTQRLVATRPHPAPVGAVDFGPDGATVATGAEDGVTRLWSITGPELRSPGLVSAANFSPDGRMLAVGSTETQLWNVADPRRPVAYGPPLPSPDQFAGTFAFTPNSRTLGVSYGRSGTVQLWNVTDPAQPTPHGPPIAAHTKQVESIAFTPDGRYLATGGGDGTVRLWDANNPAEVALVATLTGFTGRVTWVALHPRQPILAASSEDKTVRLWSINDPAHPKPLGVPLLIGNHYLYCVAFSPDGATMAVASADASITLWDVGSPEHPRKLGPPLRGPTDYVYLVEFSPDGHTLASANTDASLWLWDVTHRTRPMATAAISRPEGALYTVHYRPDGRTVALGGANGITWLLRVDPAQAAAEICRDVGDPLTREEWAKYVPGRKYNPPCPLVR